MLATTSDQFYALADALNWCSIEAYVGKLTYEHTPLVYRTLTYYPLFKLSFVDLHRRFPSY